MAFNVRHFLLLAVLGSCSTLNLAAQPPIITSPSSVTGSVGRPFFYHITVDPEIGAENYGASNLPEGLEVNPANGIISGVPAVAGTFGVSISAGNSSGTAIKELTLAIGRIVDTDMDGMADEWESAHGLNSSDPADAPLDPDEDGSSNLAEYAADTDPQDAVSFFQLRIANGGVSIVLEFEARPDRIYEIQQNPDLTSGSWETTTTYPRQESARTISFVPAPAGAALFYRVVVTP